MRHRLLTASAALVVLAGCTAGAPVTQPTIAPTAQAVATQVAPTAQAVATQVAPTVQAVATQVSGTPGAQALGTVTAASPVQVSNVRFDQNDTTITLRNTSASQLDMTGWQLRVGSDIVSLPNNAQIAPGQTLTLHTARGTSMGSDVYLGSEASNLAESLRPGAQVALVNNQGTVVAEFVLPNTSA